VETLVSIIGGVALLLWGVRMVRTGVTRSFGAELRRLLAISAKNRLTAFFSGLAVTGALQSGTATALIITSFAAQGLVTGAAALAIILGADVGTTLVVQLLSFGLNWLSPLLIAAGVFGFLAARRSRHKNFSRITLGLGLMLLALHLIALASAPLRESQVFTVLLEPLGREPILAVLVGAGITRAAHSSVAIVLLVMSLAAYGVLAAPLALALVLGANLGAAITPVGITWGSPAATRRPPLGNLLIRAAGVNDATFESPCCEGSANELWHPRHERIASRYSCRLINCLSSSHCDRSALVRWRWCVFSLRRATPNRSPWTRP